MHGMGQVNVDGPDLEKEEDVSRSTWSSWLSGLVLEWVWLGTSGRNLASLRSDAGGSGSQHTAVGPGSSDGILSFGVYSEKTVCLHIYEDDMSPSTLDYLNIFFSGRSV